MNAGTATGDLAGEIDGQQRIEGIGNVPGQAAAHAEGIDAVDLFVVHDIQRIAFVTAPETADAEGQGIVERGTVGKLAAVIVIAGGPCRKVALGPVVIGFFGDDVDQTNGGVFSEQRALRAVEHLDALDIGQFVEGGTAARHDHAVDHRGYTGLHARAQFLGADAANSHRGLVKAAPGTEA